MNANNNNEMSQELSAYLDGELNEADTAKVDEALGKNQIGRASCRERV